MIDELNCAKCKKLASKSESLQEVSTLQFQIIGGLNERGGGCPADNLNINNCGVPTNKKGGGVGDLKNVP